MWSNSFWTVTTLSVRLNQSCLMYSPPPWVISWNVNKTIPISSQGCLFAARQVGLEKKFDIYFSFPYPPPPSSHPPPYFLAPLSQEALRVSYELWVPEVGRGSEAGRLSCPGEGQRLCSSLRGELRGGWRVFSGQKVLLQWLRPHLSAAEEPLQR